MSSDGPPVSGRPAVAPPAYPGPPSPSSEGEDHRALEAERDFLLRSIADLDAELVTGELDPSTHTQLRDNYTSRAASVLRALESLSPKPAAEQGVAAPPPPAQGRTTRRRRLVGAALAALLLGLVAAGLFQAVGPRQKGATATGNSQLTDGRAPSVTDLAAEVRQRPEDPKIRLAYARALLAEGEPVAALGEFDTVARLDPDNAEALAYGGWIVFLAVRSSEDDPGGLLDGAMRRLDAAVQADPAYPDAHFFLGMVLLEGKGDPTAAVPELEAYLAAAPESPLAPQVRGVLEKARRRAADTGGSAPPPGG